MYIPQWVLLLLLLLIVPASVLAQYVKGGAISIVAIIFGVPLLILYAVAYTIKGALWSINTGAKMICVYGNALCDFLKIGE